ncbi:MAG: class I SAM-dependent methyltransferase [Fibrobacteres bacterium]|jgi:SAM-dependent methyltransferase|nr:class I SAM-dependent methyltransferase [Fibrobacterota bacterium]
MAQNDTGLRRLLTWPWFYDFFQDLVGGVALRRRFVNEFLRPSPGARVLDIGCGTGNMLSYLPDGCGYLGFDFSEDYIAAARARYGERGRFTCARVDAHGAAQGLEGEGKFDFAIAFGVLHHLDDAEAARVFDCARQSLKPGGRLATIDPAFVAGQGKLARYVVSRDRGRNVRTPEGYAGLGRGIFPDLEVHVLRDTLRIPSDAVVLVAKA